MRPVLFAWLILSPAFLLAQATNIEEVGKSPVEAKFAAGGQVRMDLCPSGVELVGKDEGMLSVNYDSKGDHDDVKVWLQVAGNRARIRVTECPHNNFRLTIAVPKSADLHVRMSAGDLQIEGITGNKDVELHAGQLTVDMGQSEDYAHVDASVLTGELEASPFGVSKGGLFRSFHRNGGGKYRLHAHVGAGQIHLR